MVITNPSLWSAAPTPSHSDADPIDDWWGTTGSSLFRRTRSGDMTWIAIAGTLDAITAPELRSEIEMIIDEGNRLVVVDLAGLEFIDSSGIAVLVALYKRVRIGGGSVELTGVRDRPMAIFKLLHLDRVFGI